MVWFDIFFIFFVIEQMKEFAREEMLKETATWVILPHATDL